LAEICIYTNSLYITIIVVFLTAFLHVLVYLVLRYTTGMTLLKMEFQSYVATSITDKHFFLRQRFKFNVDQFLEEVQE